MNTTNNSSSKFGRELSKGQGRNKGDTSRRNPNRESSNAQLTTEHSDSRNNLRDSNQYSHHGPKIDKSARRDKNDKSQQNLDYDKVRWPGYKELIYRKKNQEHLPNDPTKVSRMLGLGGPLDMGGKQTNSVKNDTGSVIFDSEFECGNIDQVRQRSMVEYDIWIRNDTNGSSNLQWFYFKMQNPESFTEMIRINVVNFTKGNSLFYYGMKPCFWSLKSHEKNQQGWF